MEKQGRWSCMPLLYPSHKDGTDFSPWRHGLSLEFLRIMAPVLYVGDEMSLSEMFIKETEDGETLEWDLCPLGQASSSPNHV